MLQRAEFAVRLNPGRDSNAEAALAWASQTLADAERLRRDKRITLAEAAEARAERAARRAEDREAPPAAVISDGEGGYLSPAPVTRAALARWLFRTPLTLSNVQLAGLLPAHQLRALDAALDVLTRGYRVARVAREHAHERAREWAADCNELLSQLLRSGLEQRIATPLTGGDLAVYANLVARGARAVGLSVCERCANAFPTSRRAAYCRDCLHRPVRFTPRPWHVRIHPGERPARERTVWTVASHRDGQQIVTTARYVSASRPTIYEVACTECAAAFEAQDARRRHCHACSTQRARTARARRRSRGE